MTKNDALIKQTVAGVFGKELMIRKIRGKTVVSPKPDFKKRVLSEKQELAKDMMATANNYAKFHMADPKLKGEAQLRLNVISKRLYTALVGEYWKKEWENEKKQWITPEKKSISDSE
jgi:hypothetical protein